MAASPTSSRASSPLSERPIATPRQQEYRFDYRRTPSVFSESRTDLTVDFTRPGSLYIAQGEQDVNGASFSPEWSSSTQGFNAISTVLNNPRKKSVPLKSSRAPFPSGPSADLPRARRKDFNSYLAAIGPAWERFQTNSSWADHDGENNNNNNNTTPSQQTSMRVKGKKKQGPPLATVPSVFFDSSFDIGNPHTFAAVTEQDQNPSPSSPDTARQQFLNPEDISLNQPLQEKLSHYMDVVEHHLTSEIQSRSQSFFAALSNLQDLQSESSSCLSRISHLRRELGDVDDRIAKRGLRLGVLEAKRDNIGRLQGEVKRLAEVGEMCALAERLVREGSWDEAIKMINILDRLVSPLDSAAKHAGGNAGGLLVDSHPSEISQHDTSSPFSPTHGPRGSIVSPKVPTIPLPISLGGLKSLASLPATLVILRSRISESLARDVVSLLRSDLTARFNGSQTAPENADALKERLVVLWTGLVRAGGRGSEEVVKKYKEAVIDELKICVKKCLPKKADIDADDDADELPNPGDPPKKTLNERSAALTTDLRALSHTEFLSLVTQLYAALLRCLDGVKEHVKLFEEVSQPHDSSDDDRLTPLLSGILVAAIEFANLRTSKVVLIRAEQHAQLELRQFLDVFNESWLFVVTCEVMARKMIVGLRGVMVSQAKGFLAAYHGNRISTAAVLVENEGWSQVEVPPNAQHWASLLVDSAVGNPAELILTTSQKAALNDAPSTSTSTSSEKQLLIEDHPYFVVGATLRVLEMLVDYLRVIINLPLLTTDTMARTIEFLKSFNSRMCQVVLGGGAIRSAGLKNITARHLALASQSVSVVITLIPYIRETFRRHLNPKQAVMLIEFDKLKQDYHEHQNEILAKLVAIMGDRLSAHCKVLRAIDWDVPATTPQGPNSYMEMLIKETLTLHKVLSKYLAGQAVEFVMSHVFAAANHRLGEEYANIELPTQGAKNRLLQDARYFHSKLSGLKDIGAPTGMLETIVMEKRVPIGRRVSAMINNSPGVVGRLEKDLPNPIPESATEKALPGERDSSDPLPSDPQERGGADGIISAVDRE